jgi:hypothetical protein
MLLADRYDDRTHFIYELLQNAEDALARRNNWTGARSVTFHLANSTLRVSHFGVPFTEADVRSICGIAESTKGLTEIGRFGIGFKSVYAVTDSPQIHSGDEQFAIDSFVWPKEAVPVATEHDQTVLLLPLRPGDVTAPMEIGAGLRMLGPRALLFLKELEEVAWSVDGGGSGLYLRSKRQRLTKNAHKVVLLGEEAGGSDTEEHWLVYDTAFLQVSLVNNVPMDYCGQGDPGSILHISPVEPSFQAASAY